MLIRHHPLHPQSQKLPKIQCAKNVKNPRNFQARFIFIPKCRTPFNQKNSYMYVILNNLIQISPQKTLGFSFFSNHKVTMIPSPTNHPPHPETQSSVGRNLARMGSKANGNPESFLENESPQNLVVGMRWLIFGEKKHENKRNKR